MYQTRKGNQCHFGMKAYEFSKLVHYAKCRAANVGDVTVTHELLHGKEDCVLGDSGYTGADARAQNCRSARPPSSLPRSAAR